MENDKEKKARDMMEKYSGPMKMTLQERVDDILKSLAEVDETEWELTDTENESGEQIGAVLVFKSGITEEQANLILDTLKFVLESQVVKSFDPEAGYPIFYIP